jgi:hypothetical protein
VLANCFVKRNHSTRNLQFHSADVNYEVPDGLSLRELVDPSYGIDDEGIF